MADRKKPDLWVRLEMRVRAVGLIAVAETTAIATAATAEAAATATETTRAATTAAEATASAATTTATAEAAFAGRTLFAGAGDVHTEFAATEVVVVELIDGLLCFFGATHGHKRETTGATGEFVEDDLDDTDRADLTEERFEVLRRGGEREVPHVEFAVFHVCCRGRAAGCRPFPTIEIQIITEHCLGAHLTILRGGVV